MGVRRRSREYYKNNDNPTLKPEPKHVFSDIIFWEFNQAMLANSYRKILFTQCHAPFESSLNSQKIRSLTTCFGSGFSVDNIYNMIQSNHRRTQRVPPHPQTIITTTTLAYCPTTPSEGQCVVIMTTTVI